MRAKNMSDLRETCSENQTLEENQNGEKGAPMEVVNDQEPTPKKNEHISRNKCCFQTTSIVTSCVMALLGSSCCLIQLILNALNFGCMGFAKLSVIRPYAITISIFILVAVWLFAYKKYVAKKVFFCFWNAFSLFVFTKTI